MMNLYFNLSSSCSSIEIRSPRVLCCFRAKKTTALYTFISNFDLKIDFYTCQIITSMSWPYGRHVVGVISDVYPLSFIIGQSRRFSTPHCGSGDATRWKSYFMYNSSLLLLDTSFNLQVSSFDSFWSILTRMSFFG